MGTEATGATRTLFDWFNGPSFVALIGFMSATISGFSVNYFKNKKDSKKIEVEAEAKFIKEIREELREVRLMVKGMDKELDEWKGKYYEILDDYSKLKGKYNVLEGKYISVKQELDEFKNRLKGYEDIEKNRSVDQNV